MKCAKCGIDKGVTFGHVGYCGACYSKEQLHQKALRDAAILNREALAARVSHPSGKSSKYRARDWIQKRDPETGRSTA